MNDSVKEVAEEKPKQHHYTSEEEILGVIKEAQNQRAESEKAALFARKMAEHYTRRSVKARNGEAAILLENADEQLILSAKLIRRAERIEKKLEQLKRTLAAFKTVDMFGNEAVVLQGL